MSGSVDSVLASPDRVTATALSKGRLAAAGLALAAVGATALALPTATFRAKSIVAITDPTSPLAVLLPRTAAEVAVSKPVMRRAAQSLIGTGVQAPAPDLVERASVAFRLDGAQATAATGRLAAELSRLTSAEPGALPGSLEIVAASNDPDRSAQIAAVVAEALIADEQATIAKTRRQHEIDSADRLVRLQGEAAAARRRLAALGGVEADPTQALAAAAAKTAAAQARLDTIRAIIAAGAPPLSDRRDVPATIGALQTSYLDLSRQLAQARETYGDRHTMIISLQAEVKHAAATLSAEWRRLGKLAEGELASAREHEASLPAAVRAADAGTGAARLEAARRAVHSADDAVAHAQAAEVDAPAEEPVYRMLARPAVPNAPVGLSALARAVVAALAGALALGLCRIVLGGRLPSLFRRSRKHVPLAFAPVVECDAPGKDADMAAEPVPCAPVADVSRESETRTTPPKAEADEDLMKTMFELLPELQAVTPSFGSVPTIMIAANEAGINVTRVALALGRAVAEAGNRVLLVETERANPELAAAASDAEEPLLVDLYGTLRVALRADTADGLLYLIPSLKHGARIAAALARGTETPMIDEIGEEFDLVVIDGARAAASAAAGWGADAYLRVGRFESKREDTKFAETFDAQPDMLLGTVVASRFRKPATARPATPVLGPASASPPAPRPMLKALAHNVAKPLQMAPLRPAAARRKLGGR